MKSEINITIAIDTGIVIRILGLEVIEHTGDSISNDGDANDIHHKLQMIAS